MNDNEVSFSAIKELHRQQPSMATNYICEEYSGDLSWCKYLQADEVFSLINKAVLDGGMNEADLICKCLKKNGIDLNKSTEYKNPLMHAVFNNSLDTARILMENGASPNAFAPNMCSAFFDAICAHTEDLPQKVEFLSMFLEYGAEWDEFLPDRNAVLIGIHTFRDLAERRGGIKFT